MAKPVWTTTQIINQLDGGSTWPGSPITYGFPTTTSWFPGSEVGGATALNASQKAVAVAAFGLWDDLIAPRVEPATVSTTANIKLMNEGTPTGDFAHAYYPGTGSAAGSVWFNPDYDATTGTNDLVTPVRGQWGYLTYIHELGHAFGLHHPGNYDRGSPTYATDALYQQDSVMYTVMSYFDGANTGADWIASDSREYCPQTPMMDDVLAIQAMYGADRTTRAANTVYGFGATAGKDVYDFAINTHPILCLYDAGGNDTLNLSGSSLACSINLAPGTFSDADGMTKNISIARNTVIENAVGGNGNDVIRGNDVANVLTGGAGNDKLYGGLGNDRLDGKTGVDHMLGGSGDDIYVVDNSGDVVDETGASGTDKVMASIGFSLGDATQAKGGIENLTLTGSASINGTGNGLANAIVGNAAANVLSGGDGDDALTGSGGADTLTGGRGADQFRFTGLGAMDTIRDFHPGQDSLVFSASGFGGGLSAGHAPVVDLTSSVKHFAGAAGGHFVYEHNAASYGTLYWDANGGAGSDAAAVAKLINVASLTAHDVHII